MSEDINFKKLREHKKSHGGRCGYASGGHVHEDEAEDKALIKKELGKAKIKLKHGGHAEGEKAHKRLDRKAFAKGGATKKHGNTKVNVIVAGGGEKPPMPVPVPAGGGMPPMAPKPPMPPMAPPAGAMPPKPMGAPNGMPPQGPMKRGGRLMRKEGGAIKMEAGAGGGKGRLEKIKEYGVHPRKLAASANNSHVATSRSATCGYHLWRE